MTRIQTSTGRRNDLTEALKRTCIVLVHQGIDAGIPEERETSLETWAQMLWQIADTFDAQAHPAPDTHLLVKALREWSHAARRSIEGDGIGQAGFDAHMLAHVNALGEWETRRIAAQVTAASI
ncbi:hypothetical protein [Nocardiopsis sp. SBT366]|uniref:hypothetical protein n=1 Tax=Nocardiopsis sp. SBT366 TaxID=1580529 RepID=UPI00066B567B|nr:hypothetical protein [Nocardiopsis sp. SBT366]